MRPGSTAQRSFWSPVSQQHLHLFHGGRLSEAAVESAKSRLGGLLTLGDREQAEACLRPGLQYAVQVQALAELGGPHAAHLLHDQLHRRVSDDSVEQSWYWLDIARNLRRFQSEASLPHLLRCPAAMGEAPLSQFFAAETACCAGFANALRQPMGSLGQAAVGILHQSLRGLRYGVSPQIIADARLGTAVATLWRRRPVRPTARIVRAFLEALRLLQRREHYEFALTDQAPKSGAFRTQ